MFIKTVAEALTLGQAVELQGAGVCVVGEDGKVYLEMEES